jgi:hypothetical protein
LANQLGDKASAVVIRFCQTMVRFLFDPNLKWQWRTPRGALLLSLIVAHPERCAIAKAPWDLAKFPLLPRPDQIQRTTASSPLRRRRHLPRRRERSRRTPLDLDSPAPPLRRHLPPAAPPLSDASDHRLRRCRAGTSPSIHLLAGGRLPPRFTSIPTRLTFSPPRRSSQAPPRFTIGDCLSHLVCDLVPDLAAEEQHATRVSWSSSCRSTSRRPRPLKRP